MSPTILVVDDAERIREVTAAMLRSAGFGVTEVGTGEEALRAAATRPDLIVLDVHLPDIEGLEVCRQLRANPDTASIPILYLSGTYREVEDKVRGLETGADGYLTKPVGAAELVATVRALLRMRRAETGFQDSEIRRRAAETLVELGRLLAQSLEPYEVGQRITDAVRRLLGAPAATLYRLEPTGDLASVGVSSVVEPTDGQPVVIPPGAGISGLAVRERAPVVTRDALTDPRVVLTPDVRARAEQASFRAVLAVPLLARDGVIGALAVGDRAGRVFTETETALLQTFADQAALAIENAELYEEARRRQREAEVIAQLARDINASLDLGTVLQRVVNGAKELCKSDIARIALREPDSEAMVYRYWIGARYEGYNTLRIEPGTGVHRQVLLTGRPFRTDDWLADPRISKEYAPVVQAEGIVAQMAVPIRSGDRVEGLLYVDNRSGRPFTDRDEGILTRLAEHAAIAIQNARLFARAETARADAEASEARFRDSQQTLRALIDAIPIMINAKDLESRYIFMNRFQATLYGVSEDEAVGKTAAELLGGSYGGYTEALDRRVIAQGKALAYFEEEYPDAHGVVHTWLTTKVPLWDAVGKVKGVATIALDISDRKHLEAQLRQSQKMEAIGRLAGGVAHDFNNLLTVIGGRSQLLRRRLQPDDPLCRHVDLIQKTAERAAALTQQLLAFSRKQMLQPQVLDLNAVVAGMERMLRRLIGEHIELVTAPGPSLGAVRADPGQVEQVILNLAVNARDAMPEGGRLILETANIDLDEGFARHHPGARPGQYVALAVTDTGAGMDAETQAHVFEPFFTTKEVGKGTGLGLATVYGIVKQSGGYITVASEPGRGARFEIYLPRVEAAADDEGGRVLAELLRGSETILLVEDQEDVRELARDILQVSGYTVLAARDGADALRRCEQHTGPIHLLLTDVVMPHMGGQELADRLAAAHPRLRVLYMSGYTDRTIVHHGVLHPGTAFLPKPFRPDALARKVREVLDTPSPLSA